MRVGRQWAVRMRAAIVLFVAAMMFVTAPIVLAGTEFSVDRQRIDWHVEPGGEVVGSFRVHNRTDVPLPMQVTPADYVIDEFGHVITPEAGSTERSLLPYLIVSPTNFTVEPGSYIDVRYVVNVPADLEGSHWISFLTRRADDEPAAVEQHAADGVSIRFRFHIAYRTLMVVTVTGTERLAAAVTDVQLQLSDDGFALAVDVRNEGNAGFSATGRVEVRDARGATVRSVPLGGMSVLPGHQRTLLTKDAVVGLALGEYIALAIVDFGGDYLTAGQLRFTVPGTEQR